MDFLRIADVFTKYYAVPDYQRDYEWTKVQNTTLLDDLLEITRENNDKESHFFGALVTIGYDKDNAQSKRIDLNEYDIRENMVLHVVDGQQRLTSFSVLIKALQDVITEDTTVNKLFSENTGKTQLNYLLLGNNFSKSGYGYQPPRLILNGNTGDCYNTEILHISNADYKKVYKGAKRLLAAYEYYKTNLEKSAKEFVEERICRDSEEFYRRFIDTLTNKVKFVEIRCDNSSDAFQVFDSLNGKGLDLTAADRIKNVFLSWCKSGKGIEKWDALVSGVGEEYLAGFFVSLFFYSKHKRISKNLLPDEFKKMYKEPAITNFDYFYEDLRKKGLLYGQLRAGRTGVKNLDEILLDFSYLGFEQIYVLLYAVATCYGSDSIKTEEYTNFARTLFNMIVRMQVCVKSMNTLDRTFSELIESMNSGATNIDGITASLQKNINTTLDDESFKKEFARFCPSDNKVAEVYLRHIENYMQSQLQGNRNTFGRVLTVEHIIPLTLTDLKDWYGSEELVKAIPEYLAADYKDLIKQNIGNKALLYSDDNTSANNNNYETKKNVYINGKTGQDKGTPIKTFCLISELLADYPEQFNHEEVLSRAKKLAEYAVKIW